MIDQGPVQSLRDVAACIDQAGAMKMFIDHLIAYAQRAGYTSGTIPLQPAAIIEDPDLVSQPSRRAYLAGMAEHLAGLAGQGIPDWTELPSCFLAAPVFFGGRNARAHVIASTPSAFRRRLVFCGPVLQKFWATFPDEGR